MIARARLLAVVAMLLGGGLGMISATQNWAQVTVTGTGSASIAVTGAQSSPVLVPLSLAALALGAALSIIGLVLRYVFGGLAVVMGTTLSVIALRMVLEAPLSSLAPAITSSTGIAGEGAIASLIGGVSVQWWPWLTIAGGAFLVLAGVLVLATAHRWRASGRRYEKTSSMPSTVQEGPLDALQSWDELSRGDDPTLSGGQPARLDTDPENRAQAREGDS